MKSRINLRFALAVGIILCAPLTLMAEEKSEKKYSPAELVGIMNQRCDERKVVANIENMLVACGEEAVPAVVAAVSNEKTKSKIRLTLIDVLGKLKAAGALPMLWEKVELQDETGARALVAIGEINQPESRKKIIALSCKTVAMKEAHVDALANCEERDAVDRLIKYLTDGEGAVSSRVRQALCHFIKNRDEKDVALIAERLRDLSGEDDDVMTAKVSKNVVLCSLALKPALRNDAVCKYLASDSIHLRRETIRAITRDTTLAADDAVAEALYDAVGQEDCCNTLVGLFKAAEKMQQDISLTLCRAGLEKDDRKVNLAAADTLAIVTKQKYGRNIAAWKQWLDSDNASSDINASRW
ncbi:MAG: hypothetical protein JXR97_13375 [Planctomycetes bacterium]|nr:hypothetical protein [Planctomycetota bacterium]